MVNAVHEEDSSSARGNSFFITNICSTSSGLVKIVNSEGVSFLSRSEYLTDFCLDQDNLEQLKKENLNEELLSSLLKAVRAYSAELTAKKYLARAEHSRFQLSIKLKKKGFLREEIEMALDYLADKKILDDLRYANAWLNTRKLQKKEGRRRLASELASRGIDFTIANKSLTDFFKENSEQQICRQALDKQIKKGLTGTGLLRAMSRLGFTIPQINICLEEKKNSIV